MGITLEQVRKTFCGKKPAAVGEHRFYSVLIPLVEKDGELFLLYEVRARHMVTQPGEVCFPGGHVETEEDPAHTALRETYEEIGIHPGRIRLIGAGNILYGYANYTLFTYLGVVRYEDYLKADLSRDEVDEIFLVRMTDFEAHSPQIFSEEVRAEIDEDFPYEKLGIGRDYPWRTGKWEIPVYEIDGRVIWGLTARITADLIREVRRFFPKQSGVTWE